MVNTYTYIFIFLQVLLLVISDDICKAEKWWELGEFEFRPNDFCLNVDNNYDDNKKHLYKICMSNLTEYRSLVKTELDNIDNYTFLLKYFSDYENELKIYSCYNKTKHYILSNSIESKMNEILPKKNNKIFDTFKALNGILEIPVIIWRGMKAFIFSGISYLSFKEWK